MVTAISQPPTRSAGHVSARPMSGPARMTMKTKSIASLDSATRASVCTAPWAIETTKWARTAAASPVQVQLDLLATGPPASTGLLMSR